MVFASFSILASHTQGQQMYGQLDLYIHICSYIATIASYLYSKVIDFCCHFSNTDQLVDLDMLALQVQLGSMMKQ